MTASAPLTFKVASAPWELEQVHRLNYRTFVEEIPQHAANPATSLVDKFDAENTYLICLRGRDLLGMIAVRGTRPFSLDAKLDDLDASLPPHRRLCEFRLLSVSREHRTGRILLGLMDLLNHHCTEHGYDLAIISGTTRQQKLYRHLGFVPFGPLVGTADAAFQPMYLTLERAEEQAKPLLRLLPTESRSRPPRPPVNLLPGPVGIAAEVRDAFAETPVSHRAESFVAALGEVKRRLGALVNARHVAVLTGSGTLANDVIAGQLSLLPDPGLVLANGEFGERLVDHATRFGLAFDTLRLDWGGVFGRTDVEQALDRLPHPRWLWAVHCETSTGVLNDLAMLKTAAATHGARLCVDCISSIGTVPVDLAGVYLASGVSGKGLAAYPGLALVFAAARVPPAPTTLPRYLDLGLFGDDGVPFTLPSNAVAALGRALDRASRPGRGAAIAALSSWLRSELEAAGFRVVAPVDHASPAVLTLALPPAWRSADVGAALRDAGYLLSYQSGYLFERNWVQICLMGEHDRASLVPLIDLLRDLTRQARGA